MQLNAFAQDLHVRLHLVRERIEAPRSGERIRRVDHDRVPIPATLPNAFPIAFDGIATSTASDPVAFPPSLPNSVTSCPVRASASRARRRCFPCRSSRSSSVSFPSRGPWLEKLDRIARRVVDQDLRAARALDDVVAEREPGLTQALHFGRDVVDQQMDAIPAPGPGLSSVRHRAGRRALRPTEEQPEIAPLHVGEAGAWSVSSSKPKCVV